MTKERRGTSSVNASDPRNEAATKRGALHSTCLFESGEIWFGERWAAPLSAQPRRTRNFRRPIPVITSGVAQPVSGRVEGSDPASCLWRDSVWGSLYRQLIDCCIVGSRDLSARHSSCQ